jgi:hypothetical protein
MVAMARAKKSTRATGPVRRGAAFRSTDSLTSLALAWRELLRAQATTLSEILAPKRWLRPEPPRRRPPDKQPPVVHFSLDAVVEGTPEQRIPLPLGAAPTAVEATALRNLIAAGTIAAEHVEARIERAALLISLVSLREIHDRLAAGAIEAGVYAGAIVTETAAPLAIVQVTVGDVSSTTPRSRAATARARPAPKSSRSR